MVKSDIAAANTLGKLERLKSRKLIGSLFSKGHSFSLYPLRVLYLYHPQDTALQAGFSASSRHFKRAVDRNFIKRRMREAYRTRKVPVLELLRTQQKQLILFIIYTGKDLPTQALIHEKMELLLKELIKRLSPRVP